MQKILPHMQKILPKTIELTRHLFYVSFGRRVSFLLYALISVAGYPGHL